jgi:hypothetical protein
MTIEFTWLRPWVAASMLVAGAAAVSLLVLAGVLDNPLLAVYGVVVALPVVVVSVQSHTVRAVQEACHNERLRAETLGEMIAQAAIERMDSTDVARLADRR